MPSRNGVTRQTRASRMKPATASRELLVASRRSGTQSGSLKLLLIEPAARSRSSRRSW